MPKTATEETLDSYLKEAESEIEKRETDDILADKAVLAEIEAIEAGKAMIELDIERDILRNEADITSKIEAELWNGAHIALLPFFYEHYTIQAQIEPELQKKYKNATIATCSRFKAMGPRGLAMVTPIIDYIRNHALYSPADRQDLDRTVLSRILTWLREDIVPEARPRQQLSGSLEAVLHDVEEAEQVFIRSKPEVIYMEGETRMAALKAVRSSLFLPNLAKIRLLESLSAMPTEEILNIGTFLLWETRKSSFHKEELLKTALYILASLTSSLH